MENKIKVIYAVENEIEKFQNPKESPVQTVT